LKAGNRILPMIALLLISAATPQQSVCQVVNANTGTATATGTLQVPSATPPIPLPPQPAPPPILPEHELKGVQLVLALRQGGFNLYMRHAVATVGQDGNFQQTPEWWDNCDIQRNMSDAGREQARKVGEGLRELRYRFIRCSPHNSAGRAKPVICLDWPHRNHGRPQPSDRPAQGIRCQCRALQAPRGAAAQGHKRPVDLPHSRESAPRRAHPDFVAGSGDRSLST